MKRLVLAAALLAALVLPAAAGAHPLGNFTINHASRIVLSGDRPYVVYTLDMAEIPAYREQQVEHRIGRPAYVARALVGIRAGLTLKAAGRRLPLRVVRSELAFPPGAAGLRTLRLEVLLAATPLPAGQAARLDFHDGTYAGRLGWKEIVVDAGAGARTTRSSVPATSLSHGLLSYPKSFLQSPLDVTSASATVVPGGASGPAPSLLGASHIGQRVSTYTGADARFAQLIARRHLSPLALALALLLAMGLGMLHALTPGHGKSIVAAYLVGSRGRARHALYLGATVTISHTIGVFALGLVTLSLSAFILPESLYPWLTLISGAMVVVIGVAAFRVRLLRAIGAFRATAPPSAHHHHEHEHGHDHDHGDHDHEHGHSHAPEGEPSLRQLIGVGISGGILPCPSALVVLLSAIALHRVAFGLALIVAFSLGLAAVVSGIGLAVLYARGVASRIPQSGRAIATLPAISSVVITCAGLVLCARALPGVM